VSEREFDGYMLALSTLREVGVELTPPQVAAMSEVLVRVATGQLTLVQSAREFLGSNADVTNPVIAELLRDDAATTNSRVVTERETAKRVIQAIREAHDWKREVEGGG
jgi:hypothetical protein